MTMSMPQPLQCSYSIVCWRCAVVVMTLLVSGCGGNGTAPSQNATTQPPSAIPPGAYPVPVYVQTLPGYGQGAQQPVQGWVMQQHQQLQPQGQLQPQQQQQLQMQQPVPLPYGAAPTPKPSHSDNPWASQAQQQHHANSWANSQPWAPTQQGSGAVSGRFRPLEGETQQSNTATPPVVTPYDQAYGSSKRPLPTVPYYGGYANAYPGAYPNQYAGGWPGGYGGYPGGWPGGYGGGYPGVWPGGYGGGFPGGWPGGYGGGPFGGFPGMHW